MNPLASLSASARQAAGLAETEHRPWPLPPGPWRVGMTLPDLLLVHWCVKTEELRRLVPPKLEVDTRTADIASSSIDSLLVNTPPTNGEVR